MSSHHVVREKQEPALLVLGIDTFDEELLGQLLEWSPTVITTQHTAEKLNSFGIKIDWIISNGTDEDLQSDVKLMSAGNDHLTDAALEYLVTAEYPAVNIITDTLNLHDFEHFAPQINIVIFNNRKKIYPISSGFNKWKPSGELVELLSDADSLETTGLQHSRDNHYHTTADGIFSLKFNNPFLFIAEEI